MLEKIGEPLVRLFPQAHRGEDLHQEGPQRRRGVGTQAADALEELQGLQPVGVGVSDSGVKGGGGGGCDGGDSAVNVPLQLVDDFPRYFALGSLRRSKRSASKNKPQLEKQT